VTEVRFHRALYADAALDQAIAVYAPHAQITRSAEGDHVVVRIESPRPGRSERVARELANHALGITIQTRGARAR
jgi:hypothetical protein